MPGVIVDIGTGDGEFVYALAKDNPDRFIIGIDPHHKGLENLSTRIYKKASKGGLDNALFILGSIEALPDELNNIANQVFINFPWSGLLKGIVLVEDNVWSNIKRICKKGAYIDILFGYQRNGEIDEAGQFGLPVLDLPYIKVTMAPRLAEKGFRVIEMRTVDPEKIRDYPSSWAKKLGYGRDRAYYYLRLVSE
jgi:16S rRNA (adenine(1408)-N(1))-methyltransferase